MLHKNFTRSFRESRKKSNFEKALSAGTKPAKISRQKSLLTENFQLAKTSPDWNQTPRLCRGCYSNLKVSLRQTPYVLKRVNSVFNGENVALDCNKLEQTNESPTIQFLTTKTSFHAH